MQDQFFVFSPLLQSFCVIEPGPGFMHLSLRFDFSSRKRPSRIDNTARENQQMKIGYETKRQSGLLALPEEVAASA